MAALAAASLTGLPAFPAIGQNGRREQDNPAGRLPSRGEFVVRDAYVMTMDPDLGDIPGGNVHVRTAKSSPSAKRFRLQTPRFSTGSG
jgi:hypothetical protein